MKIFNSRLVVLALLSACANPFATRTPEPPEAGGGRLPVLEPTSSKSVLENLKISYQGLSPLDYLDTLAEDFVFVPDTEDSTSFQNVYTGDAPWDKNRERIFAMNLLSDNVTESIRFRTWPPSLLESRNGNKEDEYEYDYDIAINHSRDAPRRVKGRARLILREGEGGRWAIVRWEDRKTDQATGTWGELRAKF